MIGYAQDTVLRNALEDVPRLEIIAPGMLS